MLAAVALIAFAPPLFIRRAQWDITPPELLPLGGYTERHGRLMDFGGDPLYARCVEMDQGTTRIALVSADMLTVPESLSREVAARIPKDVHLFLQATHTHSAPDSQMLNDRMTFQIPGIASFKRHWLSWYADQIAGAVNDAIAAPPARPVEVEATEYLVKANRPRRSRGKPDRTATRLFAALPGGLQMIFGHFTAHPVIYGAEENRTRGDWPAVLEHRWGGIVLNGALGDVSPAADGKTPEVRMRAFLSKFDFSEQTQPPLEVVWRSWDKFKWVSQGITLDAKKPHPSFGKVYGVPPPVAQALMSQFAPSGATVSAFRIGSVAIVGIPGEPTSYLGSEIKSAGLKLGFSSVLVCSHVNGWMGYILEPRDYDRGGYEATLSFYGRDEADHVVSAAIQALRKLR